MLFMQEIHDNVEKYAKIPTSWSRKNHAFKFTEWINCVIKNETLTEISKSPFHTLIINESTDITTSKMLMMYVKFGKIADDIHKTVFAGKVKLTACNSAAIVDLIRKLYNENCLDMNHIVMFTLEGASVMLGKRNGVAAILRISIPHMLLQHCVAHRKDLAVDDT